MKIVWHWLLLSAALYATTYVLPSDISFTPFYVVFVVGAVLMFINATIKPIIHILTLPITIITLGIFSLVINGLIFWFLSGIIEGFSVAGFTAAVIGSAMVSVFNWLLTKILRTE